MNVCQVPNVYMFLNTLMKVTARVHVSYKHALFARSFCIKKLYISSNGVNFLSFNNDDMEP